MNYIKHLKKVEIYDTIITDAFDIKFHKILFGGCRLDSLRILYFRGIMVSIVCKTRDFVVINKSAGIPSQSDPSGDTDAMTACSALLCDMGEKNKELYLIHRLDRVVGGLLVFARNSASAAKLSTAVAEREM